MENEVMIVGIFPPRKNVKKEHTSPILIDTRTFLRESCMVMGSDQIIDRISIRSPPVNPGVSGVAYTIPPGLLAHGKGD